MSDRTVVSPTINAPNELDRAPTALKKEGDGWHAVWNPLAKRALDIDLMHTFTHVGVVCCVRFSANGKYLAAGSNRVAQIFDVETSTRVCVLEDETVPKDEDLYIRSVCFSPDGRCLVTGAEDKRIRIWDIASKRIVNILDGHEKDIYSIVFSQDGQLMISGSDDGTVRVWDMFKPSNSPLYVLDIDEPDNSAGVTSVAANPDGKLIAAGTFGANVLLWDVQTGVLVEKLRGHKKSVYSVAFTPDGKGLLSGSLDKKLKYWDIQDVMTREKRCVCTTNFSGHKDFVLSVTVSNDSQWVISGSKDRFVQFWDAQSGDMQLRIEGHKNTVVSVDHSPVDRLLASGSGDWLVRIWKYTTI